MFVLERPGRSLARAGPDRRPAAARQLHHAGPVARRAARSTSPSPNGRSRSRTSTRRQRQCFHLFAVDADGSEPPAAHRRPGRRLRSLPAARRRRGLHVHAARRLRPLQQSLGTAAHATRCTAWTPTAERPHALVPRDQRVASLGAERRPDRLHPLGLRGPLGGQLPRPVDEQPGRHHAGILFGNYTMRINACYQPRAIPGSQRIVFVAGAHHADVGGSLVLLDPRAHSARSRRPARTASTSIEVLTPEVCFPGGAGLAQELLPQPLAAVGGLLPGRRSASIRCRA